jgi:hypothetical protein
MESVVQPSTKLNRTYLFSDEGEKASNKMKESARIFVKWCKTHELVSRKCLEIPVAYHENKISMWYPFLNLEFPHGDTFL